jgi:hypothetical protein
MGMSEGIKMDMDDLDRHLTGNYGEDSVGDDEDVSEDSDSPPTQNLWEWLESGAKDDFPRVRLLHEFMAEFYSWSLNYGQEDSPFNLFRDLTGWSEEAIGCRLYDFNEGTLGYVEADLLSKALAFWADDPHQVEAWLDRVSELELADYDG